MSRNAAKTISLERNIIDYLHTKFNMPVREASQLAKDFALILNITGKEFLKFPRLASTKGISKSVLFHSIVVCYKCSNSEEEGKPISTGIVISNYSSVNEILTDDLEIPIPHNLHIKDWQRIRRLCGYVNGENSTFIVEKTNGAIRCAKNLPTFPKGQHFFTELTQKMNDSIALQVIRGCKCFRLYSDGVIAHQIILIRKLGEWKSRDCNSYCGKLKNTASKANIDSDLIMRIAQASLIISETGRGTQMLVTDLERVRHKINKEIVLTKPRSVKDMTQEQLIRDVVEDGSSLFDKSGELTRVEVKFDATGGRVASMLDVTSLTENGLAIVVSADGPITVIEHGKAIIEL